MTALTLFGLETATSTLATACKLVTTTTGGVSANLTTKVGTIQGSGELFSLGSTATFPGTAVSSTAGVHGYLWDVTTLEGQTFLPGTWTVKFNLNWNATYTTMTSTITARVWKRSSGGTFTKIGSDMTVAGPGASTTAQTLFTLTGSGFPVMPFATGDKLYLDVWLTVTSTGGATTRTIALWASSNSTGGVAGQVEIDTPGYAAPTTATLSAGVRTGVRTQGLSWSSQQLADTFIRTNTAGSTTISNAAGWGAASDGNAWSSSGGTPTWSIASNQGKATNSTAINFALLSANTYSDVEGLVRVTTTSTDTAFQNWLGITLRYTDTTHYYSGYIVSGSNGLVKITKNAGSGRVDLAQGSTTNFAANTLYWIRFRAQSSLLSLKVWANGTSEPSSWTLTASDSSNTSGQVGLFISADVVGTSTSFDTLTFDSSVSALPVAIRTLVRTQITKSVGLRSLVRTQKTLSSVLRVIVSASTLATKSLVLRTLIRTLITKSTSIRTRVRTQITDTLSVRVPVRTLKSLSTSLRTLVRTQTAKSSVLRTLVRTQKTVSTTVRTVVRGITQVVSVRVPVRTLKSLSTSLRTVVRTQAAKSSVLRTLVRTLTTQNARIRTLIRSQVTKSTPVRTLIRTQKTLSLGLRAVVSTIGTLVTRSSAIRALVRTQKSVTSTLRTNIRTQASKNAVFRTRIRTASTLSTAIRARIRTQAARSTAIRTAIRTQHTITTPLRAFIRSQSIQITPLRAVIRGITHLAQIRLRLHTVKTNAIILRITVRNALTSKLMLLRMYVRSQQVAYATLRIMVLPEARDASTILKNRDGHAALMENNSTTILKGRGN